MSGYRPWPSAEARAYQEQELGGQGQYHVVDDGREVFELVDEDGDHVVDVLHQVPDGLRVARCMAQDRAELTVPVAEPRFESQLAGRRSLFLITLMVGILLGWALR